MDLMIQICLSNFVRVYLVPNDQSIYYMLAKKINTVSRRRRWST